MLDRARLCALVFVAAIAAFSVEQASAQTSLRSFKVGNWNGGAFARDGRFTHCAASASYGSGITMLFGIDRRYQWNIGFLNRDWRLTPGSQYDLAFSIDGGDPIFVRAEAINPTHAVIQLADSVNLFNRFRRGHVLRVASTNNVFTFNLEGTSALLAQLYGCVQQYTQPANVARSPGAFDPRQDSGQRPGVPVPRVNPAHQAEAAILLANIMSAAKVTGYTIGTPEQATKLSVDAVWITPSVVGTLLIAPGMRVDDPEIQGIVIGTEARLCKGGFMSGALPSDGARELRIITTCQPTGQPQRTSYFFLVSRPKGGLYLFTTATTGSGAREDVERADSDIRTAAYRSVN
jgi:hypothetical protein